MRIFLSLIILFSYLNGSFGQNQAGNNNNNVNNSTMMNNNNQNGNGTVNRQNLNVGNPDQGNITRPCNAYDTACIRRFFTDHSKCKKTFGNTPEYLYRKQDILYLARVNLTITLRDVILTGFNGRIEDFYVNQDTDKVVVVIEFRGLNVSSNRTYFRFHRRAKEPVVVKSSAEFLYQSLTVTTIIPQIYNLRLDKAVVFAYLNDNQLNFRFGPEVMNNTDPQVRATLAALPQNERANVGEVLLTDAPFYPATFIQHHICDFGLKIL